MLTQQYLDRIFSTLRIIHKAHWKTPLLSVVESEIERSGAFIFRIGRDPWVSDVQLTREGVLYVINSALTGRIKEQAKQYQKQFSESLN